MSNGWQLNSRALYGTAALLVATVSGLTPSPAQTAEPSVAEPATGELFAIKRDAVGLERTLTLAGTSVRTRVKFRLYAIGLYVDADGAQRLLNRFSGRSADQLQSDDSFYSALIRAPMERVIVLRFTRRVSAVAMRGMFEPSLDANLDPRDADRQAFLALWSEAMQPGDEVEIVFTDAGAVGIVRNGRVVGSVRSEAVSRAVLECWLGSRTTAKSLRRGLVSRAPEILR